MADLVRSLFDLRGIDKRHLAFFGDRMPWEWLADIGEYLLTLGSNVQMDAFKDCHIPEESEGPVYIEKGARIQAGAIVKGPVYIGRNAVIAYGAVVRDGSIVMDGCRVGKGCEIRGSVLFSDVVCKRQNYVGDSVLGRGVRLFTGSRVSNEPLRRDVDKTVFVHWDEQQIDTKRTKFGCLIGDNAVIGCGVTLDHGTIIGRRSAVHHGLVVSGTIPDDCDVLPTRQFTTQPRR